MFVKTPSFEVEIEIPHCAFRDMSLKEGDVIKFSMKKRAVWYVKKGRWEE